MGLDYSQINEEEEPQAERLAGFLIERYDPENVLDLGCATGLYLRPFWENGCFVQGVDPEPLNESGDAELLKIPAALIEQTKLKDWTTSQTWDVAICLEVLEHIPPDEESASLDALCSCSDLILFSAAKPGQGGVGHINCQPKAVWEEKFRTRGFIRDTYDEKWLLGKMTQGYHMGWFTQNAMVLRRLAPSKRC